MNPHLELIRKRCAEAAKRSGRSPDAVRLIAASKKQPLEAIQQLVAQGQSDFAESTIQEAQQKIPQFPTSTWHCIGHIQSNKTRFIPGLFNWVHSIDSEKLIDRLAQAAAQEYKPLNILLQVNTANDPEKFGFIPAGLNNIVEAILSKQYSHINLKGLMTIGKANVSEGETRRTFAALKTLNDGLSTRFGQGYFSEISMGMSNDYEIAIEEGATMIRVGTALFGERS